jgi:hypothetical protein
MSEPTQLDRIESMIRRILVQTAPRTPSSDEKIFKDPKSTYWQGESYIGSKLSECPSDYLRAYAKYKAACAWACRKEGDRDKLQYAERDEATAKLATAWAEYRDATETGESPPPRSESGSTESGPIGEDGEIPF